MYRHVYYYRYSPISHIDNYAQYLKQPHISFILKETLLKQTHLNYTNLNNNRWKIIQYIYFISNDTPSMYIDSHYVNTDTHGLYADIYYTKLRNT